MNTLIIWGLQTNFMQICLVFIEACFLHGEKNVYIYCIYMHVYI